MVDRWSDGGPRRTYRLHVVAPVTAGRPRGTTQVVTRGILMIECQIACKYEVQTNMSADTSVRDHCLAQLVLWFPLRLYPGDHRRLPPLTTALTDGGSVTADEAHVAPLRQRCQSRSEVQFHVAAGQSEMGPKRASEACVSPRRRVSVRGQSA
ncbi:hypothetical protein Tco_0832406 [Tanacetum coccineum]